MVLEFAGSNPCVMLYGPDGAVLSAASYWSADYSPFGPGDVLFLADRTNDDALRVVAYSSDSALAEHLWTFNRHFEGFGGAPLIGTKDASDFTLNRRRDGATITCRARDRSIQLAWEGLGDPISGGGELRDFGDEVGRSYRVTSTVVPARAGIIRVDERKLGGATKADYGDLPSSSFLAWCETWNRLEA